jgi:hypothetical protein
MVFYCVIYIHNTEQTGGGSPAAPTATPTRTQGDFSAGVDAPLSRQAYRQDFL